jgi:hypothetical protein
MTVVVVVDVRHVWALSAEVSDPVMGVVLAAVPVVVVVVVVAIVIVALTVLIEAA